jgi:hypothetical protein
MYDALETLKHEDLIAYICPDDYPEDPRKEWDHFTTIVCWHRRYDLGDRKPTSDEEAALQRGGFPLLTRYLRMTKGVVYLTPLGLYDHSGITIYTGGGSHAFDAQGWDSGTVGFAYVTKEQLIEAGFTKPEQWTEVIEYTDECDRKTKAPRCEAFIEQEIGEYDQYLRGDIYNVMIEQKHSPDCESKNCPHDEMYDSCGGFYGIETAKEYVKEIFGGHTIAASA